MSDPSPSQVQILQERIAALSDLYSQLQSIRHIPASFLKRPAALAPTRSVRDEFQRVKEVAALVRSEAVQTALVEAEQSKRADPSNIDPNYRREHRKRRRPPSPESPQPYVPVEKTPTTFFPPEDLQGPLVAFDGLVPFVREYNKADKPCRLHIWERTREQRQERPRMLRFTIPDVLTAYISLGSPAATNNTVIVQTVTAFGPRERKAPHTQSDYTVYRLLSQEIAKMIRSEEQVPLKAILNLLEAYTGLFAEGCTVCNCVMTAEGHVPPVVRLCKAGRREAKHVTCINA
ncbi:hypothetical protein CC1G_07403 [Coprinopsis cinerea okayama7|uniref:Uncharacterized protein n=1 Tax=Coprinopsis cinerea (strain Okayama-7 / 130 / ATCC MYA-4618 / FGSC 9003) TaxID=240176 RepID=A8N6N2_COPC7|nr:hypothetical protein CC1G_07403 [Coprinopsis cinerea okayama7\|eukprot:XP_001830488.2 hypothetical protein CC1G_07403 [Coprinopsis cinerea okayama7\